MCHYRSCALCKGTFRHRPAGDHHAAHGQRPMPQPLKAVAPDAAHRLEADSPGFAVASPPGGSRRWRDRRPPLSPCDRLRCGPAVCHRWAPWLQAACRLPGVSCGRPACCVRATGRRPASRAKIGCSADGERELVQSRGIAPQLPAAASSPAGGPRRRAKPPGPAVQCRRSAGQPTARRARAVAAGGADRAAELCRWSRSVSPCF